MADILLLQAAVHDKSLERTPPLGLLYLGAALRRAGHTVRLFDLRAFADCDPARAATPIAARRPDLVGISSHSPESPVMFRLARMVKTHHPGVPVVAGGSHVTTYPRESLDESPDLDAVVFGEGEATLLEMVAALEAGRDFAGIAGCAYRAGGEIVFNPARPPLLDMDSLPLPAWDLVDLDAYYRFPRIGVIFAHRRYMTVSTTRGCPFNCAYCHHNMGRRYRERSAESVFEEIRTLREKYDVRDIIIVDDLFNLNRERVHRLCGMLIEAKLGIGLSFPTGIRADLLDDDTLAVMRRAGTYRVMFAIETASPRLQKLIRKEVDFPVLERAMTKAKELGMLLHGAVMLGLPTETEAEMRQTIDYILRSPLDTVGVYRATPYKGCDLYAIAKAHGMDLPDEPDRRMSLWENTVNLSAAPLETVNALSRLAYQRFYANPLRLASLLWRLPNKIAMIPLLTRFFFFNLWRYRRAD